jgi:putative MATE family efflux protein
MASSFYSHVYHASPMKDLTQGSIPRHIAAMALPMAAGMFLQTLYYIVDLYFVARLGDAALAGVSAAGNVMFLVFALTQMLGVGTVALVSQATGRKDRAEANLFFNQAVSLAAACAVFTVVAGYGLAGVYMDALAADEATRVAGLTFLHWFIPGLAGQFALIVMGSALRGTGIVKPAMVVQALTVVLNAILAPVLIAGWGTGHPLGVAGAALASTLSVAVGVVVQAMYFVKLEKYVGFDPSQWRPRGDSWRRIVAIGLPAGGEFALMAVFMGVIYWIIRDFGASAQAGFGAGSRVMQMIFLPAMAVAFSAAPIAGQNYGARRFDRVRETFRAAAIGSVAIMALVTAFCQFEGEALVRPFSSEPQVVEVAAGFLRVISWNFMAMGVIFTCSGLFQALGNTWPSFIATALRLFTFAIPALWLARQPGFRLEYVWYVSVATVWLQALLSYALLRMQFAKRLAP